MPTTEAEPKRVTQARNELKRIGSQITRAERGLDELRSKRNSRIVALSEMKGAPGPTVIGRDAGVPHSYVIRIVNHGGKPPSGSKLSSVRTTRRPA